MPSLHPRTSRWALHDEVALVGRYILLGFLLGLTGQALLATRSGPASVLLAQALLAGTAALAWARLALWRGSGRGWEALFVAATATLVGLSVLSDSRELLLALAPLPWVGLRRVRFAVRLGLGLLQGACAMVVAKSMALEADPLLFTPVAGALLLAFLWRWHGVEPAGARRRLVGTLSLLVVGAAVTLPMVALSGSPLPLLAAPLALLAPRWRYSRRSMKSGATSGEVA